MVTYAHGIQSPILEITGHCHGWKLNLRLKVTSPMSTGLLWCQELIIFHIKTEYVLDAETGHDFKTCYGLYTR